MGRSSHQSSTTIKIQYIFSPQKNDIYIPGIYQRSLSKATCMPYIDLKYYPLILHDWRSAQAYESNGHIPPESTPQAPTCKPNSFTVILHHHGVEFTGQPVAKVHDRDTEVWWFKCSYNKVSAWPLTAHCSRGDWPLLSLINCKSLWIKVSAI